MYKVTNKKFKNWDERRWGKPLVCLEDEYGGQTVIATDDHCVVLFNGSNSREFKSYAWWHMEAVEAFKEFLINNPKFKA